MKILAITNTYPPEVLGGYELQCEQTVLGLRARGHDVEVLTTGTPVEGQVGVHRRLHRHGLEPRERWRRKLVWHPTRARTWVQNYRVAADVVRRLRPDVVSCWSPSDIGVACVVPAARAGIPVTYVVGGYSLAEYYEMLVGTHEKLGVGKSRRFLRLAYAPARRRARGLRIEHAAFVSQFLLDHYRRRGYDIPHAVVIHQGARFQPPPLADLPAPPGRRLVYVGRLERYKGVHTAMEAVARLRDDHALDDVVLTVIGPDSPSDPAYVAELHQLVHRLGLRDHVQFLGPKPPAEVFSLLPQHRVLLFSSIWDEPGPATPIEAMGHGVAVVATDVGGDPEYVKDGETGLIVPPEDPRAMADAAARLLTDDDLWHAVRRRGWEWVTTYLTDDRYNTEMERFLADAAGERIVDAQHA